MKLTFLHLSLYSFSIFVSEHLRLLYRPINKGRVETQVSFGKGELMFNTKGIKLFEIL